MNPIPNKTHEKKISQNLQHAEHESMSCAGLGIIEEDDEGNHIGYAKSDSCLGKVITLYESLADQLTDIIVNAGTYNPVGYRLIKKEYTLECSIQWARRRHAFVESEIYYPEKTEVPISDYIISKITLNLIWVEGVEGLVLDHGSRQPAMIDYELHHLLFREDEKVRLDYRPVHMNTLDDEIETFSPKARVYSFGCSNRNKH